MTESTGEVGVTERRLCEYLMTSAWKVQSGLGEAVEAEEEVEKEAAPLGSHPVRFLPSHRSRLSLGISLNPSAPRLSPLRLPRLYKLTHHSLQRPHHSRPSRRRNPRESHFS